MTMLEQYGDVLTVSELQEVLNIGKNTAYALLSSGAISSIRIGKQWRIPKAALMQYILENAKIKAI